MHERIQTLIPAFGSRIFLAATFCLAVSPQVELVSKNRRIMDGCGNPMTSLPAQTFGFGDRGLIREGCAADLIIFDPQQVIDRANFEQPHQYPDGIRLVLVNGTVVIKDDQHTGARSRKILYRAGDN